MLSQLIIYLDIQYKTEANYTAETSFNGYVVYFTHELAKLAELMHVK